MRVSKGNSLLRRTAGEIKVYRTLVRVLPIAMTATVVTLALVYAITTMYTKFGSFTVTVNKFDNVNHMLTLSETPDFEDVTSRLNANTAEEITNISVATLPLDLDNINGSHNGDNYMAYTFYCKNAGAETVSYEYQLIIDNMTLDIEQAVRVRLYVDGEYADYARTRNDGQGAEPGTTEFFTEKIITQGQITDLAPNEYTRYTVVVWLEGDDPECVDTILGGEFKIDMNMSVLGESAD